jgi:carbon monoxide dehydrogenase subunit G
MPQHLVQPPEWIDSAPIRVEETVEVGASPTAVWAVIADHAAWPEWFTALDEVQVTGRATGVGGQRRVVARRLPIDEEFTAWDEEEHFAFAVVRSRLPILGTMAESVRIEETGGGSRVTYRQGLQARRGFGPVLDLIWRPVPQQLRDALANLRTRVEV